MLRRAISPSRRARRRHRRRPVDGRGRHRAIADRRRREDHRTRRLARRRTWSRRRRSSRARRGRRGARRRGSSRAPRRRARSPATPRRRASSTIAWPARRARTVAVATSTPSYSSPTAFARAQRRARALELRVGQARVERQRHRDLEDPDRLDRAPRRSPSSSSLGREPPGRLHDVVVERRAEQRHEDRAVLALGLLAAQRLASGPSRA